MATDAADCGAVLPALPAVRTLPPHGPDAQRRRMVASAMALLGAPTWAAVVRAAELGNLPASAGSADSGRPDASADPAARELLSAWAERDAQGRLQHRAGAALAAGIAVPHRAHGIARDLRHAHVAYVAARRPGTYLWRIDARSGTRLAAAEDDDEFRYEGHVVVDAARGLVYATESHVIEAEGRIGVYDADTLQRIASWRSGGIGPHELLQLAPDVLAVANGGILTLPETGRVKRNLDSMQPRLALLDLRDGRVMQVFTLPQQHAGLRHLACSDDGRLGVALQLEEQLAMPLLAILHDGVLRAAGPQRGAASESVRYGAAIAACGDRFAVTCPQNDCVQVWDSDGGAVGSVAMAKPSGITVREGAFIVSSETGLVQRIDARTLAAAPEPRLSQPTRLWDNHLA